VAIIGAFTEMLKLPLGEYDIAHYAYDIERKDLQLAAVNRINMQQHLVA
jgi:D-glycero-alpha-D-manno-heptose-7-phosphate kinase